MSLKPVLSNEDKEKIREKLKELCEKCWIKQGYKKTNIKSLCDKAEISIGTFYTIYPTKEDLFLETIENIQRRLAENFFNTNKNNQTTKRNTCKGRSVDCRKSKRQGNLYRRW